METRCYGRQAVWLSVLVHCLLLAGLGFLSPSMPKDLPEKDYVELELVSENNSSQSLNNLASFSHPMMQSAGTMQPANSSLASNSLLQTVAAVGAVQAEISSAVVGVQGANLPAPSSMNGDRGSNVSEGEGNSGANESAGQPTGVILPPRIIHKVNPGYPDQARRQGLEGRVTVKIEVLADGQPGDVTVVRSSGYSPFDEAAVAAVEQWRFAPAKNSISQQPIACLTTVSLVFQLNQS